LRNLLLSVGHDVRDCSSPGDFWASDEPILVNRLILDIRMPVVGGFDLKR
jgi:FixJ family two-component response regulator